MAAARILGLGSEQRELVMSPRYGFEREDVHSCIVLIPPLAVRCLNDGYDLALQRLVLLALVFATAVVWSCLFARKFWPQRAGAALRFAMLFVLLMFETLGWGSVVLAASFGWVFALEMFGGKPVLSPVVVGLGFAIFSFPDTGFQELWVLNAERGLHLALACLPGALWLAWRKQVMLPAMIGIGLGVAGTVLMLPLSVAWWDHLLIGSLVVGAVFIAADTRYVPETRTAQIVYGVLVGVLVTMLRLADPDQPDGVVFALLLGGLFAPLIGRAMGWRARHG